MFQKANGNFYIVQDFLLSEKFGYVIVFLSVR
jgi:hypothetical protein